MTSEQGQLRILSAGAPKAGITRCIDVYGAACGCRIKINFATAPQIRDQLASGQADVDLLVAPAAHITALVARDVVADSARVALGAIATGVAVKSGTPRPDLSTAEAFRRALLAADELIFNHASSGQHIETTLKDLGIARSVEDKIKRTHTGAEVLKHLAATRSQCPLAFAQATEIQRCAEMGVKMAGGLPSPFANSTTYVAGLINGTAEHATAMGFLAWLASPSARQHLSDTGILSQ